MKIILWLLFVGLNGWLLFFFSKKFDRSVLIKGFILLIPADVVFFLLTALCLRAIGFQHTAAFSNICITIFMSIVIIAMINLFNQLFHYMADAVVSFHQKNNAANLNRQPIKFFIDNQSVLKQGATIIWFLGSALMLYGAWLGEK